MKYKEIKGSQKAKEYIVAAIKNGKFSVESPLPSERDLSNTLCVSRNSVRNALNDLVSEKIIYTKSGSGSYIFDKSYSRNIIGVNNLTKSIREQGSNMKTKIISFQKITANKNISKRMNITWRSPVYELIRLRSLNNEPAYIETLYINSNACPNIIEYYKEASSIFYIYQNIYNFNLIGGSEKISVTYPTLIEKELLKINKNSPLFYSSGITFDKYNRIIEYYKIVFRSDLFTFNYLIEDNESMKG